MSYSDKTILMTCGECDFVCEGIEPMKDHAHKQHRYSWDECDRLVSDWAEDAFVKAQEHLAHFNDDAKLERMIDADAFPDK